MFCSHDVSENQFTPQHLVLPLLSQYRTRHRLPKAAQLPRSFSNLPSPRRPHILPPCSFQRFFLPGPSFGDLKRFSIQHRTGPRAIVATTYLSADEAKAKVSSPETSEHSRPHSKCRITSIVYTQPKHSLDSSAVFSEYIFYSSTLLDATPLSTHL